MRKEAFDQPAPEAVLPTDAAEVTPSKKPFIRRYAGRMALVGSLLAVSGVAVSTESTPAPVAADSVPHRVYRTDGDGVWLHDSPGLHTPLKTVMPEGAQFDVDCFVPGGDVVNGNAVWLEGVYDGQPGAVTDYYIDTHWNTTQDLINQGIEQCGTAPSTLYERAPQQPAQVEVPQDGGSVFYAPGNEPNLYATITMSNAGGTGLDWSQGLEGECSTQGADDFPEVVSIFGSPDKRITTLGGWSIGRLGPAYFLQETAKNTVSEDSRRKRGNIDYIVLLDPGSKQNYENNCDRSANQSKELAKWLQEDPGNHLMIFAGEATYDKKTMNGKYAHQGIQETLFAPSVRDDVDITDQVVVCNYALGHRSTYDTFKEYINKPPIINPDQCPNNAQGWRP